MTQLEQANYHTGYRDPYTKLVVDDAYGRAPEGTEEILGADLHRWRNALVELNAEAMEQQATANANFEEFKIVPRLPQEFQIARADFAERKAKLGHFQKKIQRRKRHVDLLIRAEGQRQHAESGANKWRKLCLWVLSDYQDDEWDSLGECVPEGLAETLKFARRLHDEGVE